EVYEGVVERLKNFVASFFKHFDTVMQREKAFAYLHGLLSDTERKNVESIAYDHGQDRQPLQMFIGQRDWNDEVILNELTDQVVHEIGTVSADSSVDYFDDRSHHSAPPW
ncbi:MAG: transposase, partial [Planctomycetaceae bacterium]|nr:transposase [Planctomycetaceae bacterium]